MATQNKDGNNNQSIMVQIQSETYATKLAPQLQPPLLEMERRKTHLENFLWSVVFTDIVMDCMAYVFWRPSHIPIVSGYIQYDITIVLLNPCTLLNSANIPQDLLNQAQQQCQQSYERDFLHSVTSMCPHGSVKSKSTVHHLEKRAIPIIIGAVVILAVVVIGAGIGTAAYIKADNNGDRISDLEDSYTKVVSNIEKLEKRYSDVSEIVKDVVERFNSTVLYVNEIHHNLTDFRHKSVSQAYAIASVVTRLGIGVSVLAETKREWKQGRVHMPFLDYMNVSLPCGGLCAFEHAKAEHCDYDELRNELTMSIDIPIINENFILMDAEPFTLMKKTENETCRIEYNGPPQAIIGNSTDCIHPLINSRPVNTEILVYPMERCLQEDAYTKRMQPFSVRSCTPSTRNDHLQFIQLKREGSQLYIYCPYSNFTINNKMETCPNSVFVLPLNSKFKVNNQRYNVSQVKIKVQETWDSFTTMRTNWYLFDHEDMNKLLLPGNELKRLKEDPQFENMPTLHHETHYTFWTFIAVVVFGSTFIIFLIVRMCQKQKHQQYGPIVVRAVPSAVQPPQELQQLVNETSS